MAFKPKINNPKWVILPLHFIFTRTPAANVLPLVRPEEEILLGRWNVNLSPSTLGRHFYLPGLLQR